jgi:hypothetical protein
MPCASFEDLLLDYAELPGPERETVDAHVANCARCREYLQILKQLDSGLSELYTGTQAQAGFQKRVVRRLKAETWLAKPSFLPEVLDFVGWAAIIAAAACLMPRPTPLPAEFTSSAALGGAAIATLAALWIAVRSYAELKD